MADYQIKHIYVDNRFIMYKLFFWHKSKLTIKISDKDRNIHVYAYHRITQENIDKFVKTYIKRYDQKLQERRTNERIDTNLNYVYLLNERYEVKNVSTRKQRKYEIFNRTIYLQCHKADDQTVLLKKILLDYAHRFISPLFAKWLKKMGLQKVQLNFRWMVSRYGICHIGHPHKVTLALQSVVYRLEVIEYLIVHELCHILHPHHQNEFWECVEKYLPNWKALDRELLKSSLPYLDNINNHN